MSTYKNDVKGDAKVKKAQAVIGKVGSKVSPLVNWVARGLAKVVFVALALDRVNLWLAGRVFDQTLALIGACVATAALLYIAARK